MSRHHRCGDLMPTARSAPERRWRRRARPARSRMCPDDGSRRRNSILGRISGRSEPVDDNQVTPHRIRPRRRPANDRPARRRSGCARPSSGLGPFRVAAEDGVDQLDVRGGVLHQLALLQEIGGPAQEGGDPPAQALDQLNQRLVVGGRPQPLVELPVESATRSRLPLTAAAAMAPATARSSSSVPGGAWVWARTATSCSSTTRTVEISSSSRLPREATQLRAQPPVDQPHRS